MTTDTTIIANEQLRELFDYGRGLRLYPEILSNDPEALIDTLTVAIHTYCHQTAQRLSLADEYFAAWEVTVTKHLANTVKTLLANYKPPPTTPTLPPELKAALILLQEDFIISYVDKSSNDYAFFCKQHYNNLITTELNSETYTELQETPEQIIEHHRQLLRDLGFTPNMVNKTLGILYANLKYHKSPPKTRFVAGCPNTPLKQLSLAINVALRALRPFLDSLWTHAFDEHQAPAKHKHTSCPIADSSKAIIDLVQQVNVELEHRNGKIPLHTLDFSTLYTQLRLDTLVNNLDQLFETLFAHIASSKSTPVDQLRLYINANNNSYEWHDTQSAYRPKPNTFQLTPALLTYWISILVTNTVILHNGKASRQAIGLPMGTNAAVNIANFILFHYEYSYLIDRLEHRDYDRIDELRYLKRYLDDITTFNNPDYNDYKYDIYPESQLTLNQESAGLPTHTLDVLIYYNQRRHCYATTLHSKQRDPKFKNLPFTRYPHPHSYINPAFLYNSFTTELHRLHRVNSFFHSFLDNTITIMTYMLDKGYNYNKLRAKLRSFIQKQPHFYNSITPHKTTKLIMERLDDARKS
jgi:hypothetical protein